MRTTRMTAIVVGGLVLVCLPSAAQAQGTSSLQAVTHVASLAPGSIHGTVQDEKGAPVIGAMVSALGTTTAFAVTDRSGRFDLHPLSPGPYLLRAHSSGYVASRGHVVDVRPSTRAASAIALRHTATSTIVAAGFAAPADPATPATAGSDAVSTSGDDDHGEMAWRLRHLRRGILKDTDNIFAGATIGDDGNLFGPALLGRDPRNSTSSAASASASRFASSLFANTPFTGQVNLFTTGSVDTPQQMFSTDTFSRSIAYLSLGAPVGEHADWTARAALTQGDIASWIVAGDYTTRAPARHSYDLGLSYSAQRYDGGTFAAPLQAVTDVSRSAGAVYGFDTFSITPRVTLTYGGRYARYDYLDGRGLASPRVALTVEPVDHFRVSTMLSHRVTAPGAEEFMPRMDNGIWLPPQRTFSSITIGSPLEAERTNHMELEVERDIASATVSLRAFRQSVTDQQVTLFGVELPAATSAVGHYFVGNIGDLSTSGLSAGVRAAIAHRVHGSVEYSVTRAHSTGSGNDLAYLVLFSPAAVRPSYEHIHDLATAFETEVPETSTRVVVLYRVSNAFSPRTSTSTATTTTSPGPPIDARFDVQIRQSLPFMDFSNAKWEMLVAVRNFFRDASPDQSMYDEVLVLHPPKRIVGGLTLKF